MANDPERSGQEDYFSIFKVIVGKNRWGNSYIIISRRVEIGAARFTSNWQKCKNWVWWTHQPWLSTWSKVLPILPPKAKVNLQHFLKYNERDALKLFRFYKRKPYETYLNFTSIY